MKRLIIYLSAALIIFTACVEKEDNFYKDSPDERLGKVLDEYNNILISAPYGWFLTVDTETNGGYRHWMAFDKFNRVSMMSDLDATYGSVPTSKVPKISSWRLKSGNMPMLIFDTYSYLHILADPQGDNNGGKNSVGLVSDFEFYITGIANGELSLKGRYNKRAARITPATQEEARTTVDGSLKTIHTKTSDFLTSQDFIVGKIDDIDVVFSLSTRKVTCTYLSPKGVVDVSSGAYPDFASVLDAAVSSNIFLISPVTINGKNITGFVWNGSIYTATVSNGADIPLRFVNESPIPLNLGYRKDFTGLLLSTHLPGSQSPEFLEHIYVKAAEEFEKKRAPRKVSVIRLKFSVDTKNNNAPLLLLEFTYTSGASKYTGTWRYQMRYNEDGTITITDRDQSGSTNESGNETYITPLLNYFCNVTYTTSGTSISYPNWVKGTIIPKTFRILWAKNKTPGSGNSLGALIPVENPADNTYVPYPCIGILQQ